jgi:hypothetical protein
VAAIPRQPVTSDELRESGNEIASFVRCVIAALILSAASANARQTPTFASGKVPIVAIDETHKNTHTFGTASFRGLVELLQGDGYRVRPLAEVITRSSLTGIDVLLIRPAVGPTGPAGGRGYQGVDAVLARHPITEGRTPEQRVRRVATFGGSAFLPPPEAEVLLTMPRDAVSLRPLQTLGAVPSFTASTPRTPVGGWRQGAVFKLGRGRVALFGETGLFSGGPAADNRTFVLNVMHWLSGIL